MNKKNKIIRIYQFFIGVVAYIAGLVSVIIKSIPKDEYPGYIEDIKISIDQLYRIANILMIICVVLLFIACFLLMLRDKKD